MAASARQHLLISTIVLLCLVAVSSASPFQAIHPFIHPDYVSLSKRKNQIATYDNGTVIVIDSGTKQEIAQGSASDGSGVDFSAPAIIWLVWSFAVGVPLALAGIRLWRLTTGAAIGVACVVCIWAAFVNTLNASGISDLLITVIAMGAFGLGFILGLFDLGRKAGVLLLGVLGGLSIGVRIILFRPGLLVHTYFVNWLITAICGVIGFVLVITRQRASITICSSSVGTFLTALGIDLLINRQAGMSVGLRFFFDRNNAHFLQLQTKGWHPPISTEIIMAVSLALIPILAYAQHRIFKQPFKRARSSSITSTIGPDVDVEVVNHTDKHDDGDNDIQTTTLLGSTASLMKPSKEPRTSPDSSGSRSSSRFSM